MIDASLQLSLGGLCASYYVPVENKKIVVVH